MEINSKLTTKAIEKTERIKQKYKFDSKRLKGNRKILQNKIFSPTHRINPNAFSNDLVPLEYSYNYPIPNDNEISTGASIGTYEGQKKYSHYDYAAMSPKIKKQDIEVYKNSDIRYKPYQNIIYKEYKNIGEKSDYVEGLYLSSSGKHFQSEFNPRESQTDYHKNRLPLI